MSNRYTLGPDVPDDEPVRDSNGNPIDADYIDRAVEDVHTVSSGSWCGDTCYW
jgi:hypothetical protein